jgi:hypothetical protein
MRENQALCIIKGIRASVTEEWKKIGLDAVRIEYRAVRTLNSSSYSSTRLSIQ